MRPQPLAVLTLLLAVAALTGCDPKPKTSDKNLQLINRPQLQSMLNDPKHKGTIYLIDVRKPTPYAEAHLPGAINITPVDMIRGDPRLAGAKTIVVYGSGTPDDHLSWAAAKKLIALGYVNVHDFRGGMEEWLGRSTANVPLMDKRMEDKAAIH